MNRCVLTVYPEDLSSREFAGLSPHPTGEELAEAIWQFLRGQQPRITELVRVEAMEGCAVVKPLVKESNLPAHDGRRVLELLRVVESVLGMADKLPDLLETDDLPKADVDSEQSAFGALKDGPWEGQELLRSRVRHFPLPTCQWYEICEGELILTPHCVIFEPRFMIVKEDSEGDTGRHLIPLSRIMRMERDTWWYIPCLRLETPDRAYRYGWAARREEPARDFELEEWLARLRSVLAELR